MENECLYTKANHPFLGYLLVWLVCIILDKQVQHFQNPSIYPSEFSAVQCCCKLHGKHTQHFVFHTDLLKAMLTLRKSELRCCLIACRLTSVSNCWEKTVESTCISFFFSIFRAVVCSYFSKVFLSCWLAQNSLWTIKLTNRAIIHNPSNSPIANPIVPDHDMSLVWHLFRAYVRTISCLVVVLLFCF